MEMEGEYVIVIVMVQSQGSGGVCLRHGTRMWRKNAAATRVAPPMSRIRDCVLSLVHGANLRRRRNTI
jgi:hypothetical protein